MEIVFSVYRHNLSHVSDFRNDLPHEDPCFHVIILLSLSVDLLQDLTIRRWSKIRLC